MNTKYCTKRLMLYSILFAILLTSCAQPDTCATLEAVRQQAQHAIDARMAAIILVGGQTLQDTAPQLWAMEKAISAQAAQMGAYAYLNDAQRLAVFISPAGRSASGSTYYFAAWIDTAHVALVDAQRQMTELGIDGRKISNPEDMVTALRQRGFVELTAASAPTLLATLRLALGFIRSLGGTISDVLVMPTYMFSSSILYPWDNGQWETVER